MRLPDLKDLPVAGKPVLVRTGFDVPLSKDGQIADDFRICDALPTLAFLLKKNAKVIVISHLGRPHGQEAHLSLEPVARRLAELLERKFVVIEKTAARLPEYQIPHLYFFKRDIEKQDPLPLLHEMRGGDIAVLENLRFYAGERANDSNFAKTLAGFGEAYVNEAFSNSHRDHASMTGVPKILPAAAAGLQLVKEIRALARVLEHPKQPLVVLMGGIKLQDKAPALLALAKIADSILLGGGLANLFLKIRGFEIGKSVWEEAGEEQLAKALWRDYRDQLKLPVDVVVSNDRQGEPQCVKIDKVKPGQMILDIGPQTVLLYSGHLKRGQTLLWCGPLGLIENPTYAHGTFALARLFASRTKTSVFGVVGGGETLEVVKKLELRDQIDHVSTGGGAMLQFLAGKPLPGIEVLRNG